MTDQPSQTILYRILALSIEEFDPSVRCFNGLTRAVIDTVGQLTEQTERSLRAIGGFTGREVDEIWSIFAAIRDRYDVELQLKPEPEVANR